MNGEHLHWGDVASGAVRRQIEALAKARFSPHGRLAAWQQAVEALPVPGASDCDCAADTVRIGRRSDASAGEQAAIAAHLKALIPWRKGPFDLFGVHIDTEWRSDWKWRRVLRGPVSWRGARVLDVGCGSGYHLLRALGEGAVCAVGVEPMTVFQMQFAALAKLARPWRWPAAILPGRDDSLPKDGLEFDVVLSMGVLYHHREPHEHVQRLWGWTAPGGYVVLESIVVPDSGGLRPQGRYARMRNVRWVPSVEQLCALIEASGFEEIDVVDQTATTTGEQRPTAWMPWESLAHALDSDDTSRTVEGYPAPVRAVVVAKKRVRADDGCHRTSTAPIIDSCIP